MGSHNLAKVTDADMLEVCARCQNTTNSGIKCTICNHFLCVKCGHRCRECHSQCCGEGDCQFYLCEICELATCTKCYETCQRCEEAGEVTHCNGCGDEAHGDEGDSWALIDSDGEGDEADENSEDDKENRGAKRQLATVQTHSIDCVLDCALEVKRVKQ
jgi:hypothetical protein